METPPIRITPEARTPEMWQRTFRVGATAGMTLQEALVAAIPAPARNRVIPRAARVEITVNVMLELTK